MFNDIHISEQTENSSNNKETSTNLTSLIELEMEITVWALESHEIINQINAEYDQRKFSWCCVEGEVEKSAQNSGTYTEKPLDFQDVIKKIWVVGDQCYTFWNFLIM